MSKLLITSNMITYIRFILVVFEFKLNFLNNYFINNIINQVIDQLCFKVNNTPINLSFESGEFGYINLILTEFDENIIMVQIFSNLNDQFISKKRKTVTCCKHLS